MKAANLRVQVDRALDELGEQLEQGRSAQFGRYLKTMGRFPRYSIGNCLLIAGQCPEARRVAGCRAWNRLGRHVRRGERGIRILAPTLRRKAPTDEQARDEDDDDEEPVAFRTVCVFDVSQTEGKSLPEPVRVRGSPGMWLARLEAFTAERGIALGYSSELGRTEGLSKGGEIVLNATLDSARTFAVLVHELTHELLPHHDDDASPRRIRELEAEAVACVVCESIGLEARTSCSDYILSHKASRADLLASLKRVRETAAMIMAGIGGSADDEMTVELAA